MRVKILVAAGILAVAMPQRALSQGAPAPAFTGTALLYGGPQDGMNPQAASFGVLEGACGYGEMDRSKWPGWNAVSLSFQSPIMASRTLPRWACGVCLSVTCSDKACKAGGKPITVVVTDTCASCAPGDLSLQALTFDLLADMSTGRVNVTYTEVPCNPPGNMVVKVMDARPSEGGYLKIVNTQLAGNAVISDVKVREAGATEWIQGTNGWGATWEFNKFGIPETNFPLDLLITGNPGTPSHLERGIILNMNPIVEYPTSFQVGRAPSPSAALPAAWPAAPAPARLPRPLLASASAPMSGTVPAPALSVGPADAPEGVMALLAPAPSESASVPVMAPADSVPSLVPAESAPIFAPMLAPAANALSPAGRVEGAAAPTPVGAGSLSPSVPVARPAVTLHLQDVNIGPPSNLPTVQRIVNSGDQHVAISSAGRR